MTEITRDTTNNTIGTGAGGLELSPSGTEVVTINNGVVLPDGTKTEPAIRLADDTNTGIYSPVNDSIAFTGHGEDVLRTTGVASSVNYVEVKSSTTTNPVSIEAAGTDTDIDVNIVPKGTGELTVGGTAVSLSTHNHDSGYADIAHTHTLDGLSDVDLTGSPAPANGDVLMFNGTNWVHDQVAGGSSALGDLTDVTITAAAKGELLVHNGTAWVDVGVGTNDQVLTADSAQAAGVKWATPAAGSVSLNDLTDVYVDPGMAAQRYWRLYITANGGATRTGILEMEFRGTVGGADLVPQMTSNTAPSGVVSASSNLGGENPWEAFNNNTNADQGWQTATGQATPSWIQYDFGAGNEQIIKEVAIYIPSSTFGRDPQAYSIQYSNDGSNWTTLKSWTGQTSTGGWREHATDAVAPPVVGQQLVFDGSLWVNTEVVGGEAYFSVNSVGTEPTATGTNAIAIGPSTTAVNTNAIAIGESITGSGLQSTGIGSNLGEIGPYAVAVGTYLSAAGNNNVVLGYDSGGYAAPYSDALAIGQTARNYGHESIAIGKVTFAAAGATAIGYYVDNSTTTNSFKAGYSTTNILHLKDSGRLHLEGPQAAYVAPPYASGAEPTPVEGAIIWDSTNKKLKVYNGTAWETITSS